jgi:dolichol-phosphate mannosyltransferase
MSFDLCIVIPCFNEQPNVQPLVKLLDAALQDINWEAVFVDDDSPDGTAEEVRRVASEFPNVRLIHRIGRRGLAGACTEGILSASAPLVAVIDGDMQHDERKLREMFLLFKSEPQLDLVVGSRHEAGGSAKGGLSATRSLGSDFAIFLTRTLLNVKISDPMSGFFMVKQKSFLTVSHKLQKDGFKLLADMLASARGKWSVKEVGYEFRSRNFGDSKMSAIVVAEFIALIITHIFGNFMPIRFILFLFVGATGVFVQLGTVWIMIKLAGAEFLVSQFIGVLVAMSTNFMINNRLTYADRTLTGLAFIKGLMSFYLVCSFGMLINVLLANYLYETFSLWLVASVAGAAIGATWNYAASRAVTWNAGRPGTN